jgi:hypothetical protein
MFGMRVSWILFLAACRTQPSEENKPQPDESKMPGASEVRAFAKNAGVEPKSLRCHSIGETSAFFCRTSLGEGEVKKLADSWGLSLDDPKNQAQMRGRKYGCEGTQDFGEAVTWQAWASTEKPEKLADMRYARIYHRADTDKVCIEMDKLQP